MKYTFSSESAIFPEIQMFRAVMSNEELCRKFLELVLGFKIHSVTDSKEKNYIYYPPIVVLKFISKFHPHPPQF